jgi:hypothetical protein
VNEAMILLTGFIIGAVTAFVICRISHVRETNAYAQSILILETEMEIMDRTIQEIQNTKN